LACIGECLKETFRPVVYSMIHRNRYTNKRCTLCEYSCNTDLSRCPCCKYQYKIYKRKYSQRHLPIEKRENVKVLDPVALGF